MLHQSLCQHMVGAQCIAPMNEGHLFGMVREIQSLLHRGVAAAHHRQVFSLEQKSITGGTRRHAKSLKHLF